MPKILTDDAKSMMSYALSYYFEMELDGYDMSETDRGTIKDAQSWLHEQEAGKYPPSVKPTVPIIIETYLRSMLDQLEVMMGGVTISMQQTRDWLDDEVKPYGPSAWVTRALEQPNSDEITLWIIYWAQEAINQYEPPVRTSPSEYRVAKKILAVLAEENYDDPS